MNVRHYITLLLLFFAQVLWAQDGTFKSSVSQSRVGTGEQFEVSFTLTTNGDRFSRQTSLVFKFCPARTSRAV